MEEEPYSNKENRLEGSYKNLRIAKHSLKLNAMEVACLDQREAPEKKSKNILIVNTWIYRIERAIETCTRQSVLSLIWSFKFYVNLQKY